MRQHQDGEGGGEGGGSSMRGRSVCVRACECECVSAWRREESEEKGGICAGRQRQTIMNSKLRRYQRRAKGTGKRINGIGVQARG